MGDSSNKTTEENYYDRLFSRSTRGGESIAAAVAKVTGAYLEGKPQTRVRRKTTKKERDSLFWSSRTVKECPADSWSAETMLLALARYLGQEAVTVEGLVAQVAQVAPAALVRAVRYSGLVLNQHSPRRTELDLVAAGCAEVTELCRVLDIFGICSQDGLRVPWPTRSRIDRSSRAHCEPA